MHLTHLAHVDFLDSAGIADPLQRLLTQIRQVRQRDSDRTVQLQPADILHRCYPLDPLHLEQVLLEVYEQRRDSSTLHQAEYAPHACPLCSMSFTNISLLRRHQLLEHGCRSGLLRISQASESHQGVPTCQRCGKMFTQWHNFHYHVKYVCLAPSQEDEDLEHRLRVREYLNYVQGMSYAALGQRKDLTAYFSHRCILCGRYMLTTRGLMRHWSDSHNECYKKHGAWNAYLIHNAGTSNPCEFCGTHFLREHNCVVLRQYAIYMTFHGQDPPGNVPNADTVFPCQKCNKVFLTKHGLEQHLRNFHLALKVGDQLNEQQLEAYCLVMQAVETEACMDLLGNEHIIELLSQVCLSCQKTFQRKNELVRHLRSHHSSLWNQITIETEALEQRVKGPFDCYCKIGRAHV